MFIVNYLVCSHQHTSLAPDFKQHFRGYLFVIPHVEKSSVS